MLLENQSQRFNCTKDLQSIDLKAGEYKIQCYGARGGGYGTNGDYSEGIYILTESNTLSICCGEQPPGQAGGYGYGGGAKGGSGGGRTAYGGGGGSAVYCNDILLLSAAGGKGANTSYTTSDPKYEYGAVIAQGNAGVSSGYSTVCTFTVRTSGTVNINARCTNNYGTGPSSGKVKCMGWETGWGSNHSTSMYLPSGTYTLYGWAGAHFCRVYYTITGTKVSYVTTPHTVSGGSGGGSTSIPGVINGKTGSRTNSGSGYVIITCLSVNSLVIQCINCTINQETSIETTTTDILEVIAPQFMLIDNVPYTFGYINIPSELIDYTTFKDNKHAIILPTSELISKGLELTIEAIYNRNERLNSNYYKNIQINLFDFLKLLGE